MKRILGVTFVTLLVALAAVGIAIGKDASTAPKAVTTTGEIVDMGCYMSHAASGEKHASCATKCISMGMPMGLLTDKNKLYVLTMPHDSQDAYNKCKDMAGKLVQITGEVSEKDGMKAIEVTAVAAAPAAPAKKS
jgi:hypothetical protein